MKLWLLYESCAAGTEQNLYGVFSSEDNAQTAMRDLRKKGEVGLWITEAELDAVISYL